jgi:hypothetical protein
MKDLQQRARGLSDVRRDAAFWRHGADDKTRPDVLAAVGDNHPPAPVQAGELFTASGRR